MEQGSDFQNNAFKNIFSELKKRKPTIQSDAVAMLKLNDENFIKLFTDPDNEVIGDYEDIEIVNLRAKQLKLI